MVPYFEMNFQSLKKKEKSKMKMAKYKSLYSYYFSVRNSDDLVTAFDDSKEEANKVKSPVIEADTINSQEFLLVVMRLLM